MEGTQTAKNVLLEAISESHEGVEVDHGGISRDISKGLVGLFFKESSEYDRRARRCLNERNERRESLTTCPVESDG